MKNNISDKRIECPHCGHHLRISIDSSGGDQDFYDECPACCREIHYKLHIDEYYHKIQLAVENDN